MQQLMQSYQRLPGNALLRGFRVSYKRHVLTMDDLQTLYGPNWLNDQVGGALQSGGGTHLLGGGRSVIGGEAVKEMRDRGSGEGSNRVALCWVGEGLVAP